MATDYGEISVDLWKPGQRWLSNVPYLGNFGMQYKSSTNDVGLDESDSISGTVMVDGRAAPGVLVTLLHTRSRYRVARVSTDASGVYTFNKGISPTQEYTIIISSPDLARYNDTIYNLPASA
jgi:hypothetical protein